MDFSIVLEAFEQSVHGLQIKKIKIQVRQVLLGVNLLKNDWTFALGWGSYLFLEGAEDSLGVEAVCALSDKHVKHVGP